MSTVDPLVPCLVAGMSRYEVYENVDSSYPERVMAGVRYNQSAYKLGRAARSLVYGIERASVGEHGYLQGAIHIINVNRKELGLLWLAYEEQSAK